jgi:hypothetical protein
MEKLWPVIAASKRTWRSHPSSADPQIRGQPATLPALRANARHGARSPTTLCNGRLVRMPQAGGRGCSNLDANRSLPTPTARSRTWPGPRDERHCRRRPANIAAQAHHISPPTPPVERRAAHVTTRRAPTHRTPSTCRSPTHRVARIATRTTNETTLRARPQTNRLLSTTAGPTARRPDAPPNRAASLPTPPTPPAPPAPRASKVAPRVSTRLRVGRSLVPLPSVWRWC